MNTFEDFEYLIENEIESKIDRLDSMYMKGVISTDEYEEQMKRIRIWSDSAYRHYSTQSFLNEKTYS